MAIEAWIGMISGLGGVLVGAFAESVRAKAQFDRERTWSYVEARRRRIEELYETIEEHRSVYNTMCSKAIYRVGTGELAPKDGQDRPVPWAKLKMLVNLYVPELRATLDELVAVASEVGGVFAQAIIGEGIRREMGDRVIRENQRLQEVYESLTAQLAALSRELEASVLPRSQKNWRIRR